MKRPCNTGLRAAARSLCLLLSGLLAIPAISHACTVKLGYTDRERAPYYLGNGSAIPERPGAAVDLMVAALASAGCRATLVRLPAARLRVALSDGSIDMAPVDLVPGAVPYSVLPLTAQGDPDTRRALRTSAVVFVRSADLLPGNTAPREYFRKHRLAVNQGASLADTLRDDGILVDSGSGDTFSNLDKVLLRRVDGFLFVTAIEQAMDGIVAARYGSALVRLKTPLRTSYIWISASYAFYHGHKQQSEAIWDWFGQHAGQRVSELLDAYLAPPR